MAAECWICLASLETCESFCKCDAEVRPVHSQCLARWQVRAVG
jgi:hypothetical protein